MNRTQHQIDIVRAELGNISDLPADADIARWAKQTLDCQWRHRGLEGRFQTMAIAIKIVASNEMRSLNNTYQQVDKATNVLAFPMGEMPIAMPEGHCVLGNIAICADVLRSEARAQNKTLGAHFAHIIVHGVLHLMGYDHIHKQDARLMEQLEIQLLGNMGIPNPYQLSPCVRN